MLNKGHGIVDRLRQGSAQADSTLQAVRAALPESLGGHVWGATVRERTLTLLVSSAAWATRVRYHAPGLREEVSRQLSARLDRVQVRVRPQGAR